MRKIKDYHYYSIAPWYGLFSPRKRDQGKASIKTQVKNLITKLQTPNQQRIPY